MKNKIIGLLVATFAISLYAALGGPTTTIAPATGYYWDRDTVVSNVALFDTTGSTTSDTIITKRNFKPGYEYILVMGTLTGADVATCSLGLRIDAYGQNDSLLTSVLVDSILTSTDTRKLLPFHNHPGIKHEIVLQGFGSNGAEIIINEIEIYRRKPIDVMKRNLP